MINFNFHHERRSAVWFSPGPSAPRNAARNGRNGFPFSYEPFIEHFETASAAPASPPPPTAAAVPVSVRPTAAATTTTTAAAAATLFRFQGIDPAE